MASFVENAWYVAGWSREFGRAPVRVRMLGTNIVVFRNSDGGISALRDQCPHKFLPLSMGKIVSKGLQCGYHGLTFDGTGQCVRAPGQDNIPANARVRAFAVCERHDIVWLWMGAPDRADEALIFDLPELSSNDWHGHQGDALEICSNYLNVAENLVDPAHVSFVHPTTLGNAASEDVPIETDIGAEVISAHRWIRNAPPVGFFKNYGGFSGMVDRWHYYHLHLPSIAVIDFGSADASDNLKEDERDRGVRVYALHFLTPVDDGTTIDRWMHLRNRARGDEAVSASMDDMFRLAFAEDKEILEAVQREEDEGVATRPVRLAIDRAPTIYRKRIGELIERETGQQH